MWILYMTIKIEHMKRKIVAVCFIILSFNVFSQVKKPKLLVGIVVDQMRYDFLVRYKANYTQHGFNRLINQGFVARNMHYNYVPTYTGPGHSSIYTGSVPAIHGIAGNHWMQNGTQYMYCSQDDDVKTIGAEGDAGEMSPKNLKVTTICDQIKLMSNQRSKVFGISLKDRGAILPAGHTANAAYWYDSKSGKWISSSYYMNALPAWLVKFNENDWATKLLSNGWNLLLPVNKYTNSSEDANTWEDKLCKGANCCGENSASNPPLKGSCNSFPYSFSSEEMRDVIRATPFGNSLTTMLAKELLKKEKLGQGSETDVLTMSYSSTDYVGHTFGPYSKESEDTYIRLDREIGNFLMYLDSTLGKNNYLVFLSADHGVQDVPGYSQSLKIPAGINNDKEQKERYNQLLKEKLGVNNVIRKIMNEQIFLDDTLIDEKKINVDDICHILNHQDPKNLKGIVGFYKFQSIHNAPIPSVIKEKLINGYCPRRSGDIAILLEPNWMTHNNKGTTHGSPYSHDTHVPFILFGSNIKSKQSSTLYNITDIAATIANLLGTLQPNGCIGKPILEIEY